LEDASYKMAMLDSCREDYLVRKNECYRSVCVHRLSLFSDRLSMPKSLPFDIVKKPCLPAYSLYFWVC
jgi:hypothetical protein